MRIRLPLYYTASVLTLVAVSALTGCDTHPSVTIATTPSNLRPPVPITAAGPSPVDSPETAAASAMRELFTVLPADELPGMALMRVRPWLSPAMLARVAALPAAPGPSLQWQQWARARVRVDAVTLTSGERPPQQVAGRLDRKVAIAQTLTYPDGHRQPLEPITAVVTVVATRAGWRVDDYRIQ
ncbi:hypothetical protein [Nocardia terpenica]|uniref:Uncharacterized protein n=1 Tax=Nocardia terpenica TaxID=455432 RepID=A0A6G9ZEV4_9NOCA|nr:hypothetical protein [Nocardia terpenica]QIS23636.1 hypothetical protein F6W96_40585 [Nocardia terpenica]